MDTRIALVGHCGFDGPRMQESLSRLFDTQVERINDPDKLEQCCKGGKALLLVNRELVGDFPQEEGVELLREVQNKHPDVRWMLISDLSDAQELARKAGAVEGFGKADLGTPRVEQTIRKAIGS